MDWIEYLQKIGPFTTPLCVAMSLAMGWLLKDRGRILADLKDATADQIAFREKRIQEVQEGAREHVEFGKGIEKALSELKSEIRELRAAGGAR